MVRLWDIVISDKVPPDVQKKIKKVLRTQHSVGRPQKCSFCGTDTTWTVNNMPVCPKCAVEYKFLGEQWLLDPCEVCGRQGEWATDNRNEVQHFLCFIHRDAWFHWNRYELDDLDMKKEPDKWRKAWDATWARFVARMKEKDTTVE
jgi:hypothetical protein